MNSPVDPKNYIYRYPEIRYAIPMNRLFFDHGQDTIMGIVSNGIKRPDNQVNNFTKSNTLLFIQDSLHEYQKKAWKSLLDDNLKETLISLSIDGNYFERVRSVEILHQLAYDDEQKLEDYFEWLQGLFRTHFQKNNDPFLLVTIFTELNKKYGGTWVYDYEIDMIFSLLQHDSHLMKIAGLECFRVLNPDHDEVPESLWELTGKLKNEYSIDFFDLRMTFEKHLMDSHLVDYRLADLEEFVQH